MARKGRGKVVMNAFVTSTGAELELRPIPLIALQMIRTKARKDALQQGEPLDPPTYEAITALGEKERHPHDLSTLETDEDREAWEAYQVAEGRLQAEVSSRTIRLVLTRGIALDPPSKADLARWEDLGVEISEDPRERLTEYLQLEYLNTPGDIKRLVLAVLSLSMEGAPKEQVDAIQDLFRRSVEGDAPSESGND